MTEEQITFSSDGFNLSGRIVTPDSDSPAPGVLFLHGGSKDKGKAIFTNWQDFLANQGFASLAIDFRGVGDSEGVFEENSLSARIRDSIKALQVLSNLRDVRPNKLGVVAVSMGGHIAIRLAELTGCVDALALHAPAAYALEAETVPFNQEFRTILRTEGSWRTTPVFDALRKFRGGVMVSYGSRDEVIPTEIKFAYRQALNGHGRYQDLEGAGHSFMYIPEDQPGIPPAIYSYSSDFLIQYLK